VSSTQSGVQRVADGMGRAATNLESVAERYEQDDRNGSDRINDAYPQGGGGTPTGSAGASGSYEDLSEPTEQLTTPGSYDDTVASQVDEIGGTVGIINDVYEWVTGDSLLQKIVEPITGDWGRLYSLADAWDNVGGSSTSVNANVTSAVGSVDGAWNGRASEAFQTHMARRLVDVTDQPELAAEIANALRDLAEDCKEMFDVIIQALNTVASIISAAMASFAIPVYGEIKLVKAVWDTAKLIWNIYKIINLIRQTITLIVQTIQLLRELADGFGATP
jgi:uncharacterized protein YukE